MLTGASRRKNYYPARGKERWVVIMTHGDRGWIRLVELMGNPEWAANPRFASVEARCGNSKEPDDQLVKWTRGHIATSWMPG